MVERLGRVVGWGDRIQTQRDGRALGMRASPANPREHGDGGGGEHNAPELHCLTQGCMNSSHIDAEFESTANIAATTRPPLRLTPKPYFGVDCRARTCLIILVSTHFRVLVVEPQEHRRRRRASARRGWQRTRAHHCQRASRDGRGAGCGDARRIGIKMDGSSAPAEPRPGAAAGGEQRHAGWAVYRRADGAGAAPKLYHHPKLQEFSWEAPQAQDGPTMRVVKLRRGLNGRVGCEVRVVSFSRCL